MPAFDGRRDNVGYTDQTLAAGWGGAVAAGRDGRTVTVDIDATKTSWGATETFATLDAEFWPARGLYGFAMIANTGAVVAIILNTDGTLTTVLSGTSTGGLAGHITFVI